MTPPPKMPPPAVSEFIRRGTLLLDAPPPPKTPEVVHASRLRMGIESFALATFSLLLMSQIAERASVMLSVFLAAAGLSNHFSLLLKENRDDIFERKRSGFEANRRTAIGVFSIFGGLFLAYLAAAFLFLDSAKLEVAFESASIGKDTILTRTFGSPTRLVAHNGAVLITFFALAFVYRSYGALLTLGFNAFVWAVTLATLVARTGSFTVAGIAFVAVTPHLVLEAIGYVLGSMGGVFMSLGVAKYSLRDPILRRVGRAVLALLLLGFGFTVLAALAEGWYAAWVLGTFAPPP